MTKKIILLILVLGSLLLGQNPIVPPGVYMADPAAHVWKDGKLYLYCSVDESTDYYCSKKYHVLSTNDMAHWQLYKNIFASAGEYDEVPETDALLFAPDCNYKDGKYYLYYCLPDRELTEGVAVANTPYGPFKNGQNIDLHGYNEIDPCTFIDDDGQAYYLWGQFTLKMAKLKPNMTELDESTIIDSVLTESEHYFHEGAHMVKRNGIYYLVYADLGRSNVPSCIGYATSNSPTGPFEYQGVIIDNDDCDPANWNNHGSIAEFNGQWYVFYHRATHNSRKMRKACIELIEFNADGTIDEVEMTTQGAGPPLNAFKKLDAERACLLFGNVRIVACSDDNEILTKIHNDDRVAYKYLDFGEGVSKVTVRVKPGKAGGKIAVSTDMPWHKWLGGIDVPAADGKDEWSILSADVETIEGVHTLWLKFYGGEGELFSVDWIRFE